MNLLREAESAVVAFSGGVDSSFLLKVAADTLKDKVLAVTALSETYTRDEAEEARSIARTLGVRHRFIRTRELKDKRFVANSRDRCYFCKSELFRKLKTIARVERFRVVLDGSNVDDLKDIRPGRRAKNECGIRSPLEEAGLSKADVRRFSKKLGLSTWSKPAMACLASRIPYGERISVRRLKRVAGAEARVRRAFGIRGNLRVRDFGVAARIEVDKKELARLTPISKVSRLLVPLGYKEVRVDPRGYRTGSLNKNDTQGTG
jgi:uncharacterized protein